MRIPKGESWHIPIDKKAGKVVGTITFVFSKDGKTRTLTTKATNAKGAPINNVVVWEKQ